MRLVQSLESGNVYSGEVTPLPGCPDIAVSHAVYCHTEGGEGKTAHSIRLNQIKDLGYSGVLCTVHKDNKKQIHILKNKGWSMLENTFIYNLRTNHELTLWYKDLT